MFVTVAFLLGNYSWLRLPQNCLTTSEMTADFKKMKSSGARTVITFDYCGTGDDASFYEGELAVCLK